MAPQADDMSEDSTMSTPPCCVSQSQDCVRPQPCKSGRGFTSDAWLFFATWFLPIFFGFGLFVPFETYRMVFNVLMLPYVAMQNVFNSHLVSGDALMLPFVALLNDFNSHLVSSIFWASNIGFNSVCFMGSALHTLTISFVSLFPPDSWFFHIALIVLSLTFIGKTMGRFFVGYWFFPVVGIMVLAKVFHIVGLGPIVGFLYGYLVLQFVKPFHRHFAYGCTLVIMLFCFAGVHTHALVLTASWLVAISWRVPFTKPSKLRKLVCSVGSFLVTEKDDSMATACGVFAEGTHFWLPFGYPGGAFMKNNFLGFWVNRKPKSLFHTLIRMNKRVIKSFIDDRLYKQLDSGAFTAFLVYTVQFIVILNGLRFIPSKDRTYAIASLAAALDAYIGRLREMRIFNFGEVELDISKISDDLYDTIARGIPDLGTNSNLAQAFTKATTSGQVAEAIAFGDERNKNFFVSLIFVFLTMLGIWDVSNRGMSYENLKRVLSTTKTSLFDVNLWTSSYDQLIHVVTNVTNCFAQNSVSPLFNDLSLMASLIAERDKLTAEVDDYTIASNPRHGQVIMAEIDALLLKARTKYNTYVWTSAKAQMQTMINSIESLQHRFGSILCASSSRISPFSLLLIGEPGVGKSFMLDRLHNVVCVLAGMKREAGKFAETTKYAFGGNSRYMDGLTSSMLTFVIDDIGKYILPKGTQDPAICGIIAWINNIGHTPNMADLKLKAGVAFKPWFVVATSNTRTFGAENVFTTVEAALRRFPYVAKVTVKQAWKCAVNGSLDTAKVANATPTERLEGFHDIELFRYDYQTGKAPGDCDVSIGRFSDLTLFEKWLGEEIDAHRKREMNAVTTQTLNCPVCFKACIGAQCGCGADACAGELVEDSIIPFGAVPAQVLRSRFVWTFAFIAFVAFNCDKFFRLFDGIYRRIIRHYLVLACGRAINRVYYWPGHLYDWLTYNFMRWVIILRLHWRNFRLADWFDRDLLFCGVVIAVYCIVLGFLLSRKKNKNRETNVNNPPKKTSGRAIGNVLTKSETSKLARENMEFFDGSRMNPYPLPTQGFKLGKAVKTSSTVGTDVPNIHRNLVRLFTHDLKSSIGGVFLRGGYLLIPKHFLPVMRSTQHPQLLSCDYQIWIRSQTSSNVYTIPEQNISEFPEEDLAIIAIPGLKYPDIVGYFATDELLMSRINTKNIVTCHGTKMELTDKHEMITMKGDYAFAQNVDYKGLADEMYNHFLLAVTGMVGLNKGDCGAVLTGYTNHNKVPHPHILGILVAKGNGASSEYRFFNPITLREINEKIDEIEKTTGILACGGVLPDEDIDTEPNGDKHNPFAWYKPLMAPKGFYIGKLGGATAAKRMSDVIDTPDRDWWETKGFHTDKTKPPLGMWRVWQKALLKFSNTNVSYPFHLMTAVNEWMLQTAICDLESTRVVSDDDILDLSMLNDDQTMNGSTAKPTNRKLRHLNPIPLDSSAGHPWHKPKQDVVFAGGERTGTRAEGDVKAPTEILERVDAMEIDLIKRRATGKIFTAVEKDEPVSMKKVLDGKVRLIYTSPFDYTFLVRRHFGALLNAMVTYPYIFESWVGANAHSKDWGMIHKNMFQHPFRWGCDYEGFDTKAASVMPLMLAYRAFSKIIGHFGGNEDMTSAIGADMLSPMVNFFGWIYMFEGFNASGNVLTTHINGWVNRILLRTTYLLSCMAEDGVDLSVTPDFEYVKKIMSEISMGVYGDDNGCSTHRPTFTFARAKLLLASVGITITDPAKTGEVFDFQPDEDLSFLKRGWVPCEKYGFANEGIMFAPIEMDTIHKMLLVHMKTSEDDDTYMLSRNRSACDLMFHHGPEKYEHFRQLCIENIKERTWLTNADECFPSFDELFERNYGEPPIKLE